MRRCLWPKVASQVSQAKASCAPWYSVCRMRFSLLRKLAGHLEQGKRSRLVGQIGGDLGNEPGLDLGAHKRGVVTCASYEARPYGLRAGMPLSEARRLCPQAIYLPGNYQRYTAVSEEFHRILASYSPFVQPLSLDEAFVDMTGFEPLYGSFRKVAEEMKPQA